MKVKKLPVSVAIIGYGYWGPNLVRNFHELENANLVACCDLSETRLSIVKRKFPYIKTTTNYEHILKDKKIDAVIIATPISTHYRLAKQALLSGKHVWVEKPLTRTTIEAKELLKLAQEKKKLLHVDHIFIYTEAVKMIKHVLDSGELGKIYYFDSVRINLGLFQPDLNVIWDLAPHDLSIMCHLLGEVPHEVSTFATSHVVKNLEDSAYLSLRFRSGISAHVNVSWLSPVKMRRTLIAGSKKMIVYDDLEASEKVKIYDYGVTINSKSALSFVTTDYQYRTGDIYIPALQNKEALSTACEHFIDCIVKGRSSKTNAREGLEIVKIIESAVNSMNNKGHFVAVS